ncbi:tRNA (guanosine(37)-N1)-methyltransferase TrmD [Actinophytocola sp.]|uniref:tRNA (guanosine(37)-N1)-methyltransferase TrmD n=1 Tax=Actinophytocola sp. TaxID=1872138 RepID=UPI00389AD5E0
MRVDVVTIFPEYLDPLRQALLGRAIERGLLSLDVHDLRKWTHDVHKAVDDSPYGGGPGMVMKPQVWGDALDDLCGLHLPDTPISGTVRQVRSRVPRLVVPTPAGRPFTQALAREYAAEEWLMFACGRYEGIDQRVLDDAARRMPVDEVSIGDYVLVGGEVAVMVIVEAVARLLPGVLGNPASHQQDSFSDGLLEGPSYTRPEVWRDLPVPEVLRSGNHGAIARWRRDQALTRTFHRRPDLLAALPEGALDKHDRAHLAGLGDPGFDPQKSV